jgi:hypothetical protein
LCRWLPWGIPDTPWGGAELLRASELVTWAYSINWVLNVGAARDSAGVLASSAALEPPSDLVCSRQLAGADCIRSCYILRYTQVRSINTLVAYAAAVVIFLAVRFDMVES